MSANAISFTLGDKNFVLELSHRDAAILHGPEWLMKEGRQFLQAIGIYDGFTVARGVSDAPRTRSRIAAKLATEALITKLRDDSDLLIWDYSYSDPEHPSSELGGGKSGYLVLGYHAKVDVRPSGFCQLELREVTPTGRGRLVGLLDARNRKSIELDNGGEIKIRKRKADLALLSKLEKLPEFLDDRKFKEVVLTFSTI